MAICAGASQISPDGRRKLAICVALPRKRSGMEIFMENSRTGQKFEEKDCIGITKTVTLYHGSKSGIHGVIKPVSREHCDFGKGFYMGTERIQPLTLICNYPNARIYTLIVELSNLKVLNLDVGLDWALLVAYNRGKMEGSKGSKLYKKYRNLGKDCDIIIGDIADDRMFVVLDRFFNGEITDCALINCLSALKLGKQYVALTEKACKNIKIIEEKGISENEMHRLKCESLENRSKGIALANEICRKYRREGRYFDEILEEENDES